MYFLAWCTNTAQEGERDQNGTPSFIRRDVNADHTQKGKKSKSSIGYYVMPKRSKLDAPENKKSVVHMITSGESQTNVARYLNISESQISRFANREDIKQLIESESYKLMDCLPDAVDNNTLVARGMKSIPVNDHKNRELGYRASMKVLETA